MSVSSREAKRTLKIFWNYPYPFFPEDILEMADYHQMKNEQKKAIQDFLEKNEENYPKLINFFRQFCRTEPHHYRTSFDFILTYINQDGEKIRIFITFYKKAFFSVHSEERVLTRQGEMTNGIYFLSIGDECLKLKPIKEKRGNFYPDKNREKITLLYESIEERK